MKISLNWLRDYVDFDGAPAALPDLLTFAGIEVEGIHSRGVQIENVVVAQIFSSEQHPNADRLSVCRVDDGSGQPPRQIVCGAKNYRVGDKVPLALPGAVLPGDFRIKASRLRGVESEGMLCSARELGIAEDAAGLLILPPDSPVGAPIGDLFPGDTIFDLEITPNRPDLLSHAGLAREIAALTAGAAKWPMPIAAPPVSGGDLTVEIDHAATDACLFYSACVLENVTVRPSPEWLRRRLESVGLHAINNVVDITNFVMLEMGQPLHAFDAAKIQPSGSGDAPLGIQVRFAQAGEQLAALDTRTYKLAPHHLVIAAKGGRALALAGIMGGEDSSVDAGTRTVILESAYFSPSGIRRTARELGVSSDSSYRFERGVDLAQVRKAAMRTVDLLLETTGGTARSFHSVESAAHPTASGAQVEAGQGNPLPLRVVEFRPERCRRLLGAEIDDARISEILSRFGLRRLSAPEESSRGASCWEIPSHRQDLLREVDLIEEVARVLGLEAVPARTRAHFARSSGTDAAYDFQMELRRRLAGLGFAEARSISLVSDSAAREKLFAGSPGGEIRLKNPLSEEQVALRPSLLPGLLSAAALNARRGAPDLRLFEIGRVFASGRESEESVRLGIVMTGAAAPLSWRSKAERIFDMHDLRGMLQSAIRLPLDFKRIPGEDLALTAEVVTARQDAAIPLGFAGQLSPGRARKMDLSGKAPVLVAEIDLQALRALRAEAAAPHFAPLPRYPSVTRDLALLVPRDLQHARIAETLHGAGEPLLAGLQLFDLFEDATGTKIPEDRKSLAYSLTYRAEDRTLRADEVNAAHERLKARLTSAFDLRFRE